MTSWSFKEDDDYVWLFALENKHVEIEVLFRGGGYKLQNEYRLAEANNDTVARTEITLQESNTLYVTVYDCPIQTLTIQLDQASAEALRAYMNSIRGRPNVGSRRVANVLTTHEYESPNRYISNSNSNGNSNRNNSNGNGNSNRNNNSNNNNSNGNNSNNNNNGNINDPSNPASNDPVSYKGGYKRRQSRRKTTYRKHSKATRRR